MTAGSLVSPGLREHARTSSAGVLTEGIVADRSAEAAEVNRWMLLLGVPFALASLFFMLMLGTGQEWLIGVALATGPGLLIMAVIYLSLSTDTNRMS